MSVRETSAEVYRSDSFRSSADRYRDEIVSFVRTAGVVGMTRREIADGLRMDVSGVSGRVFEELDMKDDSRLWESEETRVSRTGRAGHILIHTDYASNVQARISV